MKLKIVELFAGVGGITEGLKETFEPICSVEMDPVIAKSYAANHGDGHLIVEDITKIDNEWWKELKEEHGTIDLLASTPPCQGFSVYNRKRNKNEDIRNDLVFQTNRILNILKPRYIIFENVKGFTRHSIFKEFIHLTNNLDENGYPSNKDNPSYQLKFEIVNAADYGVPQNRNRFILVGKRINSFPDKKSVVKFDKKNNQIHGSHEIWPKIKKRVTLGEYLEPYNLRSLNAGGMDNLDSLHTTMNLSDKNLERIKMTAKNGGTRFDWSEDYLLPSHTKNVNNFVDVYGRMDYSKQAPTITTGCIILSKGRFGHPVEDRAISLREAALIQTFPLTYTFHGSKDSERNMGSKGSIAKQIGNAVPVKLAKCFGDEIFNSYKKIR